MFKSNLINWISWNYLMFNHQVQTYRICFCIIFVRGSLLKYLFNKITWEALGDLCQFWFLYRLHLKTIYLTIHQNFNINTLLYIKRLWLLYEKLYINTNTYRAEYRMSGGLVLSFWGVFFLPKAFEFLDLRLCLTRIFFRPSSPWLFPLILVHT